MLKNLALQLSAVVMLDSLAEMLTHCLLLPCEDVPLEHGKRHEMVLVGIVTSSGVGQSNSAEEAEDQIGMHS